MYNTLSQFYTSDEWRNLRKLLIAERVNKTDGILYCEYSGKPLINSYDIVAHHKQPLTMANVNDYTISLNPENIMLVSQQAHNEIHKRFGYCTERKVYYVFGAPCSGKTSFVNANKGNSDIIIDMDDIWQCITGGERYSKPNALKQNAFMVRDCLLDMVKTRYGKWEKAWIITGGARLAERMRQIDTLGAEPIYIDTDKNTCLERLHADSSRRNVIAEWEKYINDWYESYQPDPTQEGE